MSKFIYILFWSLLGIPASYTQVNYTPNMIHVPMLNKRYDGDAILAFAVGKSIQGIELQGSFSPYHKVAVAIHYLNSDYINFSNSDIGAKYQFAEAAAGVYHAFPQGCMSLLGGAGRGNIRNSYGQQRHSKFLINRFFLQPGITYRRKKFFTSAALRFVYLAYPFGETDFSVEANDLYAIRTIDKESPFFIPELGLQTGFNFLPFHFSLSLSSIMMDVTAVGFSAYYLALTAGLDIGDIREKKKKKNQ